MKLSTKVSMQRAEQQPMEYNCNAELVGYMPLADLRGKGITLPTAAELSHLRAEARRQGASSLDSLCLHDRKVFFIPTSDCVRINCNPRGYVANPEVPDLVASWDVNEQGKVAPNMKQTAPLSPQFLKEANGYFPIKGWNLVKDFSQLGAVNYLALPQARSETQTPELGYVMEAFDSDYYKGSNHLFRPIVLGRKSGGGDHGAHFFYKEHPESPQTFAILNVTRTPL